MDEDAARGHRRPGRALDRGTSQGLTITGGTLAISANYSTSPAPAPLGAGNRRSTTGSKLTQ